MSDPLREAVGYRRPRSRAAAGFDSVWGNDHMTTQRYVQKESRIRRTLRPLMTFAYCASPRRGSVATGIIVLPMRNMPVLAKQVATLDQLSGDRSSPDGHPGAYREGMRPSSDARARAAARSWTRMQALRLLFTERRATFRGGVHFESVLPGEGQDPMPIYAGVIIPRSPSRRAVRPGLDARGALPRRSSAASPTSTAPRRRRAGDGSAIDIAPQPAVSIGRTHEGGPALRASALQAPGVAEGRRVEQTGGFDQRNLIGSPAEILSASGVYERVSHHPVRHAVRGRLGRRDAGGHRAVRSGGPS